MANQKMDIEKKKCVTHKFRVSFPAVFKAKAFEDQDAKYSVVMLFDKDVDLGTPADGQKISMKKAVFNAKVEKWGPDKSKWPKKIRSPFRDGEERSDTDGYENCIFVTASSKTQPGLVNRQLKPILDEEEFYAGCYARAEIIAFAYDTKGNKGVGFALQNIQKLEDGEPFSGRKDASEVFDAVESDSDDEENYDDDEDSGDDDDGMFD